MCVIKLYFAACTRCAGCACWDHGYARGAISAARAHLVGGMVGGMMLHEGAWRWGGDGWLVQARNHQHTYFDTFVYLTCGQCEGSGVYHIAIVSCVRTEST